jgi:hypothetical protein
VSTPSGDDQFTSSSNAHAVLLLQYLDSNGDILMTYESDYFTGSATPETWSNLFIQGVAPAGTVTGRTVCALLGLDDAFGGAVWFDDVVQTLEATGPSVSGLLYNPSFEDGPTGNSYYLAEDGDLPCWDWLGGTNAGFITRDYAHDGEQNAVLTYPMNLYAQQWAAESGKTYVAEGYIFTPSGDDRFTSDGTSYGQLMMTFYVDGSSNAAVTFTSTDFTTAYAADQWHYFAVTGTAPAEAVVTGMVSCLIYSDDPEADWDFGGIVCFDDLHLEEYTPSAAWVAWQVENFGSSTAPNSGETDDYDGDGYNNWQEFIAGTQPTNDQAYLKLDMQAASDLSETVLSWPGSAGRYYAIGYATNLLDETFVLLGSNIAAVIPNTTYTDAPPAGVERRYYRITVQTNQF